MTFRKLTFGKCIFENLLLENVFSKIHVSKMQLTQVLIWQATQPQRLVVGCQSAEMNHRDQSCSRRMFQFPFCFYQVFCVTKCGNGLTIFGVSNQMRCNIICCSFTLTVHTIFFQTQQSKGNLNSKLFLLHYRHGLLGIISMSALPPS